MSSISQFTFVYNQNTGCYNKYHANSPHLADNVNYTLAQVEAFRAHERMLMGQQFGGTTPMSGYQVPTMPSYNANQQPVQHSAGVAALLNTSSPKGSRHNPTRPVMQPQPQARPQVTGVPNAEELKRLVERAVGERTSQVRQTILTPMSTGVNRNGNTIRYTEKNDDALRPSVNNSLEGRLAYQRNGAYSPIYADDPQNNLYQECLIKTDGANVDITEHVSIFSRRHVVMMDDPDNTTEVVRIISRKSTELYDETIVASDVSNLRTVFAEAGGEEHNVIRFGIGTLTKLLEKGENPNFNVETFDELIEALSVYEEGECSELLLKELTKEFTLWFDAFCVTASAGLAEHEIKSKNIFSSYYDIISYLKEEDPAYVSATVEAMSSLATTGWSVDDEEVSLWDEEVVSKQLALNMSYAMINAVDTPDEFECTGELRHTVSPQIYEKVATFTTWLKSRSGDADDQARLKIVDGTIPNVVVVITRYQALYVQYAKGPAGTERKFLYKIENL